MRKLLFLFLLFSKALFAQAPTIQFISPNQVIAGTTSFTTVVTGRSFSACTADSFWIDGVQAVGAATYLDFIHVSVVIPSARMSQIKTVTVQAICPSGSSNLYPLMVISPLATITRYTPSNFVNGTNTPITVYGQNFVSNATILFDWFAQTTTFVNSGQLTATIPGADITGSGPHLILVYNGTYSGGSPSVPAPNISFSTTTLAFGSQQQSTTSATHTSVVTSSGSSPLIITGITKSGTNAADFTLAGTCTAATYPVGQTCTISSQFTPTTTSSESASISVADNVAGSPQTISLTGTGTVAGNHSVVLNWTASSSGSITGYNIYRGTTSGGPYSSLTTGVSCCTYTDSSVANATTYYYVVTAVGTGYGIAESLFSNQYMAVIP